jgi:transcriptional regulator with PAS, ATPase and Fis domain
VSDPSPPPSGRGRPKGSASVSWRALFQQTATPVFVLGKTRRVRYANPAWEHLTRTTLADALGMVCTSRQNASALASALAPTPDARGGRIDRARRPSPHARTGPPWWDVTFVPLTADGEPLGFVGFVEPVGEAPVPAARKIPPPAVALRERHATGFTLDLLGGVTAPAERLVAQVRHAAQATAPLWLIGEPGSGKETVARVVHHAGPARERTFLAIDCGGLQPYLIDSVLFGHGGAVAAGHVGTVYLKNPAELPRDALQRVLDVFLEPAPSAPRLVCGAGTPAETDVRAGRLLPDFHTALSVLEITVPPLRDRLDDLPRFVSRLLDRVAPPGVTPAVEPAVFDVLRAQPWPGNLRELAGVLADAAEAGQWPLRRDHLPREVRVRAGLDGPPAAQPFPKLDATLEAIERRLIGLAMAKARGNATKAAERLGIWRTRLLRRVEALGIGEQEWPQKCAK